jgi:Na+/proline symporter
MFFFVADQATLQRLLAARRDEDMKLSYLGGCLIASLLIPLAVYTGIGMLAVYHDNAQTEIPAGWVANLARDSDTGLPRVEPDKTITAETIDQLAADGLILDPNTSQRFTDTQGLIDARGEVLIDRLATRAVRQHGGERLLRKGGDQLAANFVRRYLRSGGTGLVLAALAAAVMAVLDSGLSGLATVLLVDFHRRFGWAEPWLAGNCGKTPDDLDQADELKLGRPVILVLGAAIVAIAVATTRLENLFAYLLGLLSVFAGPLLGVFLLGLLSRRSTGRAAVVGMIIGIVTAVWANFGHWLSAGSALAATWPFEGPLGPFWPLSFALAATLAGGYTLSFFVGSRVPRDELTGLVVGLGPLGVLLESEEGPDEQQE